MSSVVSLWANHLARGGATSVQPQVLKLYLMERTRFQISASICTFRGYNGSVSACHREYRQVITPRQLGLPLMPWHIT